MSILRKLAAILAVSMMALLPASGQDGDLKSGKHHGERKQFSVDIEFSGAYGFTITDDQGTTYIVGNWSVSEDKVYPPEYQGIYPLYFFGTEVGVTVTITNHGPRNRTKFRITTEAFVLHTDGSSGVALTDPQTFEADLRRGETKVIDASFIGEFREGAESGLDRFVVYVQHVNEGGGPGNRLPALIAVEEGVYCPPEIEVEAVLSELLD